MALQGTLDTFALPDVMRLVASAKKSGRLMVSGDRGEGSVWVLDGAIVGSSASNVSFGGDRAVIFDLLRFGVGSFTFDAGAECADPHSPVEVEPVLAEAEVLLAEWREIAEIVPSLDAWVSLVEVLPAPEVAVDQEAWALVATVGRGTTVRALGDALGFGEIDASRAVALLVARGLAAVSLDAPFAASTELPPPPAVELPPLRLPEPVVADPSYGFEPVANARAEEPAASFGITLPAREAMPLPDPVPAEPLPLAPVLVAPADPPYAEATALDAAGLEATGPEPVAPAPPAPLRFLEDDPADRAPRPAPSLSSAHPPVEIDSEPRFADDPEPAPAPSALLGGERHTSLLSPEATRALASAEGSTGEEGELGLPAPATDEDEPINRGLLLKFLSSVRT